MKKCHIFLIALPLLIVHTVVTQAFAQFFVAQGLEVLNQVLRSEISEEQYRDYVDAVYDELQIYLDLDNEDMGALYKSEGLSSEKHDLLQENLTDEFTALANSSLSEEEKLISTIAILFKLQEMNLFDERSFDFDFLIADKQNLTPGLQFFLDYAELRRTPSLQQSERYTRVVRPFVTDVQILSDTAKVSAMVEEIILYEDGNLPGGSLSKYEINFVKINSNWLISEIRSDHYMEAYYVNNNRRLDVESVRQELLNEKSESEQKLLEIEAAQQELLDDEVF